MPIGKFSEAISTAESQLRTRDELGLDGIAYQQYRVDVINTHLQQLETPGRKYFVTLGNRGLQYHVKIVRNGRERGQIG